MMEISELIRKCKRFFDNYTLSRRAYLIIIILLGFLLYLGPSIFRWVQKTTPIMIDPNIGCVSRLLEPFAKEENHFDATISRSYDTENIDLLPYVGNGKIGLPIEYDSSLYIFRKRSLSLPTSIYPIVKLELTGANTQEGTVVHFTTGKAYKFQCFSKHRKTISISNVFYAHRTIPSLLVQIITVTNSLNEDIIVTVNHRSMEKSTSKTKTFGVLQQKDDIEYIMISDKVQFPDSSRKNKIIPIAVALPKLPDSLKVEAKKSITLVVRTVIQYSPPINLDQYDAVINQMETAAHEDLQRAFQLQPQVLEEKHMKVWQQLWNTGFGISYSRAQGVLNGDKINATLYYVLSNARAYLSEYSISSYHRQELNAILSYSDRCYGDHHPTLQAESLWTDLKTIENVNQVVSLWLLTLDKKGCHKLIRAGAEGVMQAMVLSLGAFMFSAHHLEFNTGPKELHRDYYFRRLSYGNATHINISVIVGEDNKAVIYAALDDSDKEYYACDAGCLDPPIKLQEQLLVQFPVKQTAPLTAILYITSDYQHIEELKHTIHVKEIVEAPAHEHHVLALHRHGHQLGGLPALFWVSIVFLIVVFHLFLAKLIYNEYCGNQDKSHSRYVV